MSDLAAPLAAAGVPIFALSTWCVLIAPSLASPAGVHARAYRYLRVCARTGRNTDYVLVPIERVTAAVDALRAAGWMFDGSAPPAVDAHA